MGELSYTADFVLDLCFTGLTVVSKGIRLQPGYKACSREITAADRDNFCEKVTAASKSGNCLPLHWFLGPEPSHSVSNLLALYLLEKIMETFITDKCIFIDKATVAKEQTSWLAVGAVL